MGNRVIFVAATAFTVAGYFAFAWSQDPPQRIGWAVLSVGAICTYASWLGVARSKPARISDDGS